MPPCPVCDATTTPLPESAGTYALVLCGQCGLRSADPMRHPGRDWYEQSAIYGEVQWNIPPLSRLRKRWEFAQALQVCHGSTGRCLDVGCGRGDFLVLARERGLEVTGLDLNEDLLEIARNAWGIPDTFHGTLEQFIQRGDTGSFQLITAFEVLEHLPDPLSMVRKLHGILAEGGRLVVSVPSIERWPFWLDRDVDYPPHHLTLWSDRALRTLLHQAGFSRIEIHRKPLLVNDIMYHAVRRIPGLQAPGLARRGFRGFLKIFAAGLAGALRAHPRAGGFTLFATGVR